jgi:hypothetical protein
VVSTYPKKVSATGIKKRKVKVKKRIVTTKNRNRAHYVIFHTPPNSMPRNNRSFPTNTALTWFQISTREGMIFITVGGRVIVFHLPAYGSYGIHFSPVAQKGQQRAIRLLQRMHLFYTIVSKLYLVALVCSMFVGSPCDGMHDLTNISETTGLSRPRKKEKLLVFIKPPR